MSVTTAALKVFVLHRTKIRDKSANADRLLILLSVISFLPQLRRVSTRQNADGVSLTYVLFNLVVGTQQFALYIHMIAFQYHDVMSGMINDPPSFGDWLNLIQFGIVWLGHFALFTNILYFPPSRGWQKFFAIAIYLSHLSIAIFPLMIQAAMPAPSPDTTTETDRSWITALYWGYQTIFINPVITFVGLLSLFIQARETSSRTTLGALSPAGLGWQAIVFLVLGISWLFRMTIPREYRYPSWRGFVSWYQLVGWAAVDNLVFAFVQAVQCFLAWRRREMNGSLEERAPLLQ